MILLLEGANCCGKSTLAKSLADDLGLEITKFQMPPTTGTFEYFWDILTAAGAQKHLIVDRCHLSNAVYGALQGGGLLNPSQWQAIDQWFVERGAWLFLMTDDVFRIEDRVKARGREIDAPIGRPELAQIQRDFEKFYRMSQIPAKGQYALDLFFDIDYKDPHLRCGDKRLEMYQQLLNRCRTEMGQ